MIALTVGSLFSGIGGLELGLERAGMKTVWQVESDPYARRVLAKHWPRARRYNDVRQIHGTGFGPACLEHVDLICGGFPCQDISAAGKGAGIEKGKRSGLWREFARVIGEVRPSWILIENVPALRTRGLVTVLKDLAALGYDAEWSCLSASEMGAPHRRSRIFVFAYPAGEPDDLPPSARQNLSAVAGTRPSRTAPQPRGWPTPPEIRRVADGVPSRVDRLRCLGNAVVPQVAEFIGRRIMEARR